MSEQENPHDTQMAVDSSGEDAVGTTEDPADRPEPVSDGDAVAGNPASGSSSQPDLPEDVGPDAVPPRHAESNEYDKE